MRKERMNYWIAGIGAAVLIGGLALLKLIVDPQGIMQILPYILIGLGCGAFGHGFGEAVSNNILKKDPQLKRQLEIEKQDERNIAIANQAKAKAYDMMLYVFGALMIAYALMRIGLAAVLLLVAAYLLVVGISVFYLNKYQSEM